MIIFLTPIKINDLLEIIDTHATFVPTVYMISTHLFAGNYLLNLHIFRQNVDIVKQKCLMCKSIWSWLE